MSACRGVLARRTIANRFDVQLDCTVFRRAGSVFLLDGCNHDLVATRIQLRQFLSRLRPQVDIDPRLLRDCIDRGAPADDRGAKCGEWLGRNMDATQCAMAYIGITMPNALKP